METAPQERKSTHSALSSSSALTQDCSEYRVVVSNLAVFIFLAVLRTRLRL